MPQGILVKGIGGFYYVKYGDKIIECKARGKFRNQGITPLVGDLVDFSDYYNSCVIDNIAPRKNELVRPPVANIDQAIIVFAAANPEPNLRLLDRFLILAEYNNLAVIICINKIDLVDMDNAERLMVPYKNAGYRVIYTSTKKGSGIDELKNSLRCKINVFAGPSGVGKSSLLNVVQPGYNLKTGDLSDKLKRGKHTTRHCELLGLTDGGFVVDTPGFSSLDIDSIDKEELQHFFPEFADFSERCKFYGCSHVNELECAVKSAVADNLINPDRYSTYVDLYNELSKTRRRYK